MNKAGLQVTFLGTGTSQGVPIIGCTCSVCTSNNPHDKRLRASIALKSNNKCIVIDSGTDFRQQLLRAQISDIDALLYTHEHKDHIAGLDDVRPINFIHKKSLPLYAEQRVLDAIKNEFHYAFTPNNYGGAPQLELVPIKNEPFSIDQIDIMPIRVYHHKLPVFGYRINNFAYITDANYIAEDEKEKIKHLNVLVVNALRREEHISHFNLSSALELINELQPKQAYITHISHQMGLHEVVNRELPKGVSLAFDQLTLSIP